MKYLLISFFLISLTSCGLQTTKGLLQQNPSKKEITNLYFANRNVDYIYKAKIDVYENKFSGILIIKKTDKDQHRIVFTTEFGNKIFDFEFLNDTFRVNYILHNINKKIIINAMRKDFHLLVDESNLVQKEYLTNTNGKIYQSKINNKHYYYYVFNENSELKKAIMASKTREKVIILFDEIEHEIADKITISHHNFDLNIDLKYINK